MIVKKKEQSATFTSKYREFLLNRRRGVTELYCGTRGRWVEEERSRTFRNVGGGKFIVPAGDQERRGH